MIGDFVQCVGLFKMFHIAVMHEAGIDDVLDLVKQMLPIAVQIEDNDWLLMQTELSPGGNLHGFIECAKAARQNNEGVAFGIHHFLALVHCVHDMQLGDASVADFNTVQEPWDDPGNMAARLDHTIGDSAHQAHFATTIDKTKLPRCNHLAQLIRTLGVNWILSHRGTSEHTNLFH